MYKYEMDTTRTVGATEQTRDAGRTDGETKAPVTLYCDPTALARRFEISQSAVGSHENTKKYSE